jgi:hypothetical protein
MPNDSARCGGEKTSVPSAVWRPCQMRRLRVVGRDQSQHCPKGQGYPTMNQRCSSLLELGCGAQVPPTLCMLRR